MFVKGMRHAGADMQSQQAGSPMLKVKVTACAGVSRCTGVVLTVIALFVWHDPSGCSEQHPPDTVLNCAVMLPELVNRILRVLLVEDCSHTG